MSVSPVSSAPPAPPPPPQTAAPAAAASTSTPSRVQRAADGDYKVANAQTSQAKDKDGDYKASGAVTANSGAVQTALTNLKVGG